MPDFFIECKGSASAALAARLIRATAIKSGASELNWKSTPLPLGLFVFNTLETARKIRFVNAVIAQNICSVNYLVKSCNYVCLLQSYNHII